ncbi:MAG: NADPH-dependent FMN reductase [Euryarchaeota archaeon]|nr:NADPH-dependent FMN reductase [Euryarchaeota archaeon]
MAGDLRIMGICGTYGLDSANGRMLEIMFEYCRELGAECIIWDNAQSPLPLVGAEGSWDDENVKTFQELASSSDAFVLSSPEYHGTMSGVMKNSLDWLYSKHTSDKPFSLMCTLGGQASNNTLNHMRIAARWIHGWVTPEQVAVPHIKEAFDDDGNLIDEKITERVEGMAKSLVDIARHLKSRR